MLHRRNTPGRQFTPRRRCIAWKMHEHRGTTRHKLELQARLGGTEELQSDAIEVPCWSLAALLRDLPDLVALIHCDVQGVEADVLLAGSEALTSRVRRIVIGTHGRGIEGRLLDQFFGLGWTLEHEATCIYRQLGSGRLSLLEDGVQVWRNPRL